MFGAWSRDMYWSAGALKEKEVELWSATKKGLERWSAVTPGRAPGISPVVYQDIKTWILPLKLDNFF